MYKFYIFIIMKEKYTKTLSSRDLNQYISDVQEGEYNVSEICKIHDIEHFENL